MFERSILDEIQCKILIELLLSPNCKATCRGISDLTHIGGSTWSKQKKSLGLAGLIESEYEKEFDLEGRVVHRVVVKLTQKGKLVAHLLIDISNILVIGPDRLILAEEDMGGQSHKNGISFRDRES